MLNVECWMLNLNVEMLNVEGWNTTFQHFNIVKRSTFQCWQHLRFFGSESNIQHWKKMNCWQHCQHLYKFTQHWMLKTSTCWNVENVERLKDWNVEMLRLKCWFLYYPPLCPLGTSGVFLISYESASRDLPVCQSG